MKGDFRVNMKVKLTIETASLLTLLMLSMASNPLSAATTSSTLSKSDFQAESFSKTVDFLDYARQRATDQGYPNLIPAADHAYVYTVWINTSGIQLFYTGLVNLTFAPTPTFTIPIQTFMEHFKSPQGKDVLVSSSFLTLLSFKEGSNTIYQNSPDRNDTVWASFSAGTSVPGLTHQPRQNNTATITPLASSVDKTEWTWGMTYQNLTAVWWRINPDPVSPTWYPLIPFAITTYSELSFGYNLKLDASTKQATLNETFTVGEMTNLWFIDWSKPLPVALHYNDTGNYYMNGTQHSAETIHQFAAAQNFKLSVVLFQTSIVIGHTVHTDDPSGNSTDSEHDVSSAYVNTSADDGEQLFQTNFGTKSTYNLVNSTSGQTRTGLQTNTRTARVYGYTHNPAFATQTTFLHLLPYAMLAIRPAFYAYKGDLDIDHANFVYIISYPTWSGYKIIHDPAYIAYYSPPAPAIGAGLIAFVGIVAIVVISGAILLSRRRHLNLPASPAGN